MNINNYKDGNGNLLVSESLFTQIERELNADKSFVSFVTFNGSVKTFALSCKNSGVTQCITQSTTTDTPDGFSNWLYATGEVRRRASDTWIILYARDGSIGSILHDGATWGNWVIK